MRRQFGRRRDRHGQAVPSGFDRNDAPDRVDMAGDDMPAQFVADAQRALQVERSEEHTSELQSLMRISYAVFCLKKKNNIKNQSQTIILSRTNKQACNHMTIA